LIVVDSSGWLEFFADGPHAEEFEKEIRRTSSVLAPTIALYEVYKWVKRERSEEEAVRAVATMKKSRVVDITEELALTAADLSGVHKLSMADAIMLAVARAFEAELMTTDSDFEGIEGVTVLPKKKPR